MTVEDPAVTRNHEARAVSILNHLEHFIADVEQ